MRAIQIRDEALVRAANLLSGSSVGRRTTSRVSATAPCKPNSKVRCPSRSRKRCGAGRRKTIGPKDLSLPVGRRFLLNELKDADLRGLGGAGIPATQKWRDVRDAVRTAVQRRDDTRAFIVVNGDESEPGTFKDRELLLRTAASRPRRRDPRRARYRRDGGFHFHSPRISRADRSLPQRDRARGGTRRLRTERVAARAAVSGFSIR